MKRVVMPLFVLLMVLALSAHAEQLPPAVQAEAKTPLQQVGSGTYRKFGFTIYHVTFWTADGTWNKNKPYALQIRYARDLSKETLVDNVIDDMRDENAAADETVEGWKNVLNTVLSDVREDDSLISLCLPQQAKSPLFHNDRVILRTADKAFMQAFFAIWLGDKADEDLRARLLGQG